MWIFGWLMNRLKWLQIHTETQVAMIKNEYPPNIHPSVWLSRQEVRKKKALEGIWL